MKAIDRGRVWLGTPRRLLISRVGALLGDNIGCYWAREGFETCCAWVGLYQTGWKEDSRINRL
jgi:hypothetical protein